ncbi:MAG TPA: UDP-N-acetylmuramoyl-L-alanine--D-glutamate ligase [Sphingomicrobium sp.]|nr:UDP-N-acetylmuramoyl-L-alanine--D-glutamate ligase [Sphingomicrobium sp.]
MITAKAFAGKRYGVYGLARSGLATARALLASGASVTAWDLKKEPRDALVASIASDRASAENLAVANLDEADLSQLDSLVVTPGLPLNRHPVAQRARAAGVEIVGDIELFARARKELPSHKVVGITGTNGKSTTTALVDHILKSVGVPTTMGGNIGLPILAQEPLPKGGVYVLELSSYQIDLTRSLACDVAVLLNITPDHLDRYQDFDSYAASKERLFTMSEPSQVGVIIHDEGPARSISDRHRDKFDAGNWHDIDPSLVPEWLAQELGSQREWPSLQGPHNALNAAAAAVTCIALGVAPDAVRQGLRSFTGLPHRMEHVRDLAGVAFVNDSKATNPTAVAPALAAFDRIRWILGGQAKTDNLDECAPYFAHVASAYTIGDAAGLFERLLSSHVPVKNCGKLEVAVREAAADAKAGDTVLLSPACASFDQFRDFEDRGEQFRALVGAL